MTPPIMGITPARVVLHSIDMARKEVCDLIVDTGSTLSWVPEEVAARVGHPGDRGPHISAGGRTTGRPTGRRGHPGVRGTAGRDADRVRSTRRRLPPRTPRPGGIGPGGRPG